MISEDEFQTWHREYRAANASIVDREASMDACAEKIECNMVLLGATAIEDRLQDGVPECIAKLAKAVRS
jgi:phospholipid-translocating ATPase